MNKNTIQRLCQPMAKINIGLHVVGRREDGHHNLETVFYPVPLSDTLEIRSLTHSAEPYTLQTSGFSIGGEADNNLIIKVYASLRDEFDLPPLDIYLDKKIPLGAGLGGGSSDATSMMLMLNEEFNLGLSIEEMEGRMSHFGADCPFFVRSMPVYATGIGDKMLPIDFSLKGYYIAMVKPLGSVSTSEAFAGITPKPSEVYLPDYMSKRPEEWRGIIVNDFEDSVFNNYPQLGAIKETLYDMGALYASMSGSGSTLYGLFKRKPFDLKKIFSDCFTYQARILR